MAELGFLSYTNQILSLMLIQWPKGGGLLALTPRTGNRSALGNAWKTWPGAPGGGGGPQRVCDGQELACAANVSEQRGHSGEAAENRKAGAATWRDCEFPGQKLGLE